MCQWWSRTLVDKLVVDCDAREFIPTLQTARFDRRDGGGIIYERTFTLNLISTLVVLLSALEVLRRWCVEVERQTKRVEVVVIGKCPLSSGKGSCNSQGASLEDPIVAAPTS